jgi:hypothetical protein
MSDKTSETYYQINRDLRLAYQKNYYKANVELIKRKRELEIVLDPEKSDARKAYNRAYFLKNRASIMEKRAARRKRVAEQQKQDEKH